jgi:hypothetical protein
MLSLPATRRRGYRTILHVTSILVGHGRETVSERAVAGPVKAQGSRRVRSRRSPSARSRSVTPSCTSR